MNRMVLGAFAALVMVAVGLFWWQGRAQVEEGAPPPLVVETSDKAAEAEIPVSDAADQRGPEPPAATELTREQKRFFRYDRNRDLRVTRNEMLSTRANAFRKLDVDGNNLLTFEEWAVTTVNRFEGADSDGNRELTQAEFASTAPKKRAPSRPRCRC